MAVLLILFVGSISAILLILKQYRDDEEVYGQAAVRFTLENDQKEEAKGEGGMEDLPPITVVLFSEYTTSAYSDTYVMYPQACPEMDEYLKRAAQSSNFQSDIQTNGELTGDAHYVLLSTCAYVFDNASDVLRGKLVPVNSIGGVPVAAK